MATRSTEASGWPALLRSGDSDLISFFVEHYLPGLLPAQA